MIAVINYETSNLGSISNSLKKTNTDFTIIEDPQELKKFNKVILPGVGSFEKAMNNLIKYNWVENIKNFAQENKPVLGICLGMQLLFDESEEYFDKNVRGLGLINGRVKKLKKKVGFKIPHVGWNNLKILKNHKLFEGISPNTDYYFVHSFKCIPKNEDYIICKTEHSELFTSVVIKNNIVGLQFHPEKSPPNGHKLIKNFCNLSLND